MHNKKRPRTTSLSCSVDALPCKRSSMATKAVITLLALLHSPNNNNNIQNSHTLTHAFTFQTPSVMTRPQHSFTQLLYTSNNDGSISSPSSPYNNAPIRTNQPLSRLTQQEEVALLKQMRSSRASISQRARQTLLLHNLPLVQSIVTSILRSRPHLLQRSGSGSSSTSNVGSQGGGGVNSNGKVGTALSKDDLLHEGTIGLAEAIDRYDLAYAQSSSDGSSSSSSSSILPQGARLGTYATYWIRARIIRAIQSREHVIRFPEHVLQASHRLVKAAKEMELEWNVVTELAEYDVITVTQKKLRDKLRSCAGIKSDNLFEDAVRVRTIAGSSTTPLESWMSPLSTVSLEDNDEQPSLEDEGGQEHIVQTLSKFLCEREVEVLSLRYGLVSAEEEEDDDETVTGGQTRQPQVFRDYQSEAEEDLFGPNGMLSHYSDIPSDTVATVASASETTRSRMSSTVPTIATTTKKQRITKTPNHALLPFKEIGKRMQFSGEYCRRTCSIALNKLTLAAEDGRLAESDFLLGF